MGSREQRIQTGEKGSAEVRRVSIPKLAGVVRRRERGENAGGRKERVCRQALTSLA